MDHEIELRHLRYFVAVAEELHFGRAAKRLHVSQPPLSQQIRRLEDLLGYMLFERTSRSVALTNAGEVLLARAHRTLELVRRDLEETRTVGKGEVGSLHIGFVSSAMLVTLPRLLRDFRATYPQVQLHLHEAFTSLVEKGLQDGTLDIGVLRDGDRQSLLSKAELFKEPYVAVLPTTHPCANRTSVPPAMLRKDPFVYHPRMAGPHAYEKPMSIFAEHGFRPQIVQEASQWLSILRLVGAGLGVAVAPACVRQIATKDVVCLPLKGATVMSTIELAWGSQDQRRTVQQFVTLARKISRTR